MGMWVMRVLGVDEKSTDSVKKKGGTPQFWSQKIGVTHRPHKFRVGRCSRRSNRLWRQFFYSRVRGTTTFFTESFDITVQTQGQNMVFKMVTNKFKNVFLK